MKMVKKVLMGLALCTAFSFVGCSGLLNGLANGDKQTKPQTTENEDKDIAGTATLKTLNGTNDGTKAKRVYVSTTLKHSGALVNVKFKNPTAVSTGKMGLMFDLKGINGGNDFYIIGVNPNADVANFYVSKFSNVTEFQAWNFGTAESDTNTPEENAKIKGNLATEVEYVALGTDNFKANEIPAAADDGSITFTIYYKLTTDGDFVWAVLDMPDAEVKKYNSTKKMDGFNPSNYKILRQGTIKGAYPAADPAKLGKGLYDYYADGATLADGTTAKKQNYIGFYGQIAAGTTLDGEFYIPGTTFKEPEDAE